jgi:carbonic anhydrase
MHWWKIVTALTLPALIWGCDALGASKATTHKKKPKPAASASAAAIASVAAPVLHAGAANPPAAPAHPSGEPPSDPENGNQRFALPFAWESSDQEPLAKTRDFMKELYRDNQEYMRHGPKFFESFAKVQKPRATVVACSDSRVHTAAWDATPENDDFTIRNIGNQIQNAEGSVEYGIEHLGTSVLLVVGHTGCGAVKAAMGDKSALSPSIQHELEALALPKDLAGQNTDSAWTQAVVANVHNQVKVGLGRFGHYVTDGRLTVVGAVYDFRDDLGKGPGRITVVNVNGNSEPARLSAFVAAITGARPPTAANGAPSEGSTGDADTTGSAEQIAKRIEAMPELSEAAHNAPAP